MARTTASQGSRTKAPPVPADTKAGTRKSTKRPALGLEQAGLDKLNMLTVNTKENAARPTADLVFEMLTEINQPPGTLLMTPRTTWEIEEHDIPTYRDTGNRLRQLLGVSLESTADVLGVSRSTASKNTPVSVDSLDRVHSLSVNLARARAVFGHDTVAWFTTPLPALGGLSPLELQQTRYGERRLTTFIQNMLDGAFI